MIPRPVPVGKYRKSPGVKSVAVNDICEELSKENENVSKLDYQREHKLET